MRWFARKKCLKFEVLEGNFAKILHIILNPAHTIIWEKLLQEGG